MCTNDQALAAFLQSNAGGTAPNQAQCGSAAWQTPLLLGSSTAPIPCRNYSYLFSVSFVEVDGSASASAAFTSVVRTEPASAAACCAADYFTFN